MEEKQIRALLGDTIAHVKERLSFTRPRTLSIQQCIDIDRKLNDLLVLLPSFEDNKVYEQD